MAEKSLHRLICQGDGHQGLNLLDQNFGLKLNRSVRSNRKSSKNRSPFRGGPLFSVGPVRQKKESFSDSDPIFVSKLRSEAFWKHPNCQQQVKYPEAAEGRLHVQHSLDFLETLRFPRNATFLQLLRFSSDLHWRGEKEGNVSTILTTE